MSTDDTGGNGSSTSASSASISPPTIRSLVSGLLSRFQFANFFGQSFDSKRDIYSSLGYERNLTINHYRLRYKRGGIARRIINGFPKAAWVEGCSVFEDPDPDIETEFERQVQSLDDRLDLWSVFLRASILARLGRYSCILIGTNEPAPVNLESELPRPLSGPNSIVYLTPLAEDRCQIDRLVGERADELSSPRFGLPATYNVQISDTISRKVHWSRIIHVAEDLVEDSIYGTPSLEAIWNLLDDLDKIVGGGSEAAWKRMDPGKQFNLDPEYTFKEGELDKFKEQVTEFDHGLTRNLFSRGVDMNVLQAPVHAFGANAETVLQFACATTNYSKRWFMGSEVGELASSQDRDNMADRISEYRTLNCEPALKQFFLRLIEYNALIRPAQILYVWPSEDEMTESEKAELIGKIAQANKAQTDANQPPIMTSDEIRDLILKMKPIEIEEEEDEDVEGEEEEIEEEEEGRQLKGRVEGKKKTLGNIISTLASAPLADWQVVQRSADRLSKKFKSSLISAYQKSAKTISAIRLESAIKDKNLILADQIVLEACLDSERRVGQVISEYIERGLIAGAESVLRNVKRRGEWGEKIEIEVDSKGLKINESPESDSVDQLVDASRQLGRFDLSDNLANRSSERSGDSEGRTAAPAVNNYWASPESLASALPASERENIKEIGSCQHSPALLSSLLQGESHSAPEVQSVRTLEGRGGNPAEKEQDGQGSTGTPVALVGAPSRDVASPSLTSLSSISFTFDATNPRATSWALLHSSKLITEISESTRQGARDLIRRGIEEGRAPRKLSQEVRQSIGLRTDQIRAVERLGEEIRAAKPGSTITRFPSRPGVRSQPGFKVKVLKKITERWINQQKSRYANMQLNHRARMISRSELLRSANQGQKELWLQARDAGQIDKDQKRILIVTPDERLRKAHSSASGQIVGIDEPFDMGDGTTEPGEAVACRCGQSLV